MEWTPEASDERLFAAYRDGDAAAYEVLFRRYQEPLRRHLERMLDDRTAAEDVTVETFLRLHRHRDRFRAGTTFRPWAYAIARNLARNHLRAARVRRWLEPPATEANETPERHTETRRRVAAAFTALPVAQREVCSLRLLGGLPLQEIASVTGAAPGTVKSRLFYGLKRLRQLLADLEPGRREG